MTRTNDFGAAGLGAGLHPATSVARPHLSPTAAAIVERIRAALLEFDLVAKDALDAAEMVVALLVADLRARRPTSIATLGVLPAPGETIRDPREP